MIWRKQKCWFVSGHHPRNVRTLDSQVKTTNLSIPIICQASPSKRSCPSSCKRQLWKQPADNPLKVSTYFAAKASASFTKNTAFESIRCTTQSQIVSILICIDSKNRLKKPLSRVPPPKRPPAFQATPLNSVLMRLESWHGKLQLSKCHGPKGCKNKPRKPKEQHPWTLGAKSETKQNYVKQLHCSTSVKVIKH